MDEEKQAFTRRFKMGMVLITGSLICGYTSLVVLGGAAGTGKVWLRDLCITVWFLTWIPFFAGFYLSGKEGLQHAKGLIREYMHWFKASAEKWWQKR